MTSPEENCPYTVDLITDCLESTTISATHRENYLSQGARPKTNQRKFQNQNNLNLDSQVKPEPSHKRIDSFFSLEEEIAVRNSKGVFVRPRKADERYEPPYQPPPLDDNPHWAIPEPLEESISLFHPTLTTPYIFYGLERPKIHETQWGNTYLRESERTNHTSDPGTSSMLVSMWSVTQQSRAYSYDYNQIGARFPDLLKR